MKLKSTKQAPLLVAAGVIGLFLIFKITDVAERVEDITYDLRVRSALNHPVQTATNLAFVKITDDSVNDVGYGWVGTNKLGYAYNLYWPRKVYGWALEELAAQHPKAVAFNVMFGEPHSEESGVLIDETNIITSDQFFGLTISNAGNVVLAAEKKVLPLDVFRNGALAVGDISADKDSDGSLRQVKAFTMYRKWNGHFLSIQKNRKYGVDLNEAEIKPDKIVLKSKYFNPIEVPLNKEGKFNVADIVKSEDRYEYPYVEQRVWQMGVVLAARELKLDLEHAEVDLARGRIILRGPNNEFRVIPVDHEGYFYVNWRLPVDSEILTKTTSSIEDLLAMHENLPVNQPANWYDKLVVIGSTATGNDMTDQGETPLGPTNPYYVSVHWNVANSIITNQFVRRAGLLPDVLLIIALGALTAILERRFRVPISLPTVLAVDAVYVGLAYAAYVQWLYWIPIVLPVGGSLAVYGSLQAYQVIFEQRDKRRMKGVFSKVVAPSVVDELLSSDKLSIEGTSCNLTVFFSDIRGFTEMTDVNRTQAEQYVKEHNLTGAEAEACFEKSAKETLDTVNMYLATIAEQVIKHNGTIDKFIGDCVMAFWGAPTPNDRHATDCVRAAVDVQRAVNQLNQGREEENRRRAEENIGRAIEGLPRLLMLPVLYVGSGINTGTVTVGLMGSDAHFLNYTVFGREVNLASRLEGVSGRGHIIISEATLAEIIQDDPDLALSCQAWEPVKVKGIANAVRIYEVPWRDPNEAPVSLGDTMIMRKGETDTMIMRAPGKESKASGSGNTETRKTSDTEIKRPSDTEIKKSGNTGRAS